ncbi:putative teichuronic acid biosynthesis glycosyltransferase TuaG [Alishewanella longhuensis]|uniref:Teichuronic acid biosynthesis glycosyltransferase TuaG n=1 Tax=Alishewanella longhuensis TaxID=1091037 RepID=A0ABQ3KXF4_9ALTE|nr:glycosyltransferase family 2 protein [Alishewanella longhuensis]GHG68014.1 putative teichuronic acid biosynthesis glycosyltransferase TuaG [Alishewanella longhuensis]
MTASNPVVSVIMPAYNTADFIAESIESVLSQRFTQWELLIVNDCSTDNTLAVIQPYLTDKRIVLLNNEQNLGGAGSRNKAIAAAKGRYLAFLDADDIWTTDKLEKQIAFMQQHKLGFSFTGYTTMTEDGQALDPLAVPAKIRFSQLLKHNYIGCLTAIYDTEPFGKIYMPLVRKRQDFALWLELLKRFDFAWGINTNLGFYRIRAGSLSASKIDAFKFYWRVLREVAGCNWFTASYNLCCYLAIVFLKKKCSAFYNRVFIR